MFNFLLIANQHTSLFQTNVANRKPLLAKYNASFTTTVFELRLIFIVEQRSQNFGPRAATADNHY